MEETMMVTTYDPLYFDKCKKTVEQDCKYAQIVASLIDAYPCLSQPIGMTPPPSRTHARNNNHSRTSKNPQGGGRQSGAWRKTRPVIGSSSSDMRMVMASLNKLSKSNFKKIRASILEHLEKSEVTDAEVCNEILKKCRMDSSYTTLLVDLLSSIVSKKDEMIAHVAERIRAFQSELWLDICAAAEESLTVSPETNYDRFCTLTKQRIHLMNAYRSHICIVKTVVQLRDLSDDIYANTLDMFDKATRHNSMYAIEAALDCIGHLWDVCKAPQKDALRLTMRQALEGGVWTPKTRYKCMDVLDKIVA